jgi:hypothetical protein
MFLQNIHAGVLRNHIQTLSATSPPAKSTSYFFETKDAYYQSPQIPGSAGSAIASGDVWFRAWAEPNKLRAECNDTRPACHRSFYGLFLPLTVLTVSVFRMD